jgi:V/A-type H+-transporting ATPase subunit I
MITKMKKLALLVYHKEYAAFLESLREVGVVHI